MKNKKQPGAMFNKFQKKKSTMKFGSPEWRAKYMKKSVVKKKAMCKMCGK